MIHQNNAVLGKEFNNTLKEHGLIIKRETLKTLQINMGKLCNQVCKHCHVEAGPKRTEVMTKKTIERILGLLEQSPQIDTVDITGGAPELNPNFRYLVQELNYMAKKIINRCNLTILQEKGQEDTPLFLRDNNVIIYSSLPCYTKDNVDKQRGDDVFIKSIASLKSLNSLGYGIDGSGLILKLIYNPMGPYLPPDQKTLEKDYKVELEKLGVDFNQLLTITNMPIKRFAKQLIKQSEFENYHNLLLNNFNPVSANKVMCREMLSISWDGKIYDCDFNQMLDIFAPWENNNIWDINKFENNSNNIAFSNHCFGCTAGAGSSCGGSLI